MKRIYTGLKVSRACGNVASVKEIDAYKRVTEKQFQEWVRKAALANNFLFYHPWLSIKSVAGYPDCTMTKKGRLIFAELKADGKELTQAQQEWLDALKLVPNVEVYYWTPSQIDEIWEILKR